MEDTEFQVRIDTKDNKENKSNEMMILLPKEKEKRASVFSFLNGLQKNHLKICHFVPH